MNPWHELGLEEGAGSDEVRRAYRRLAAEHHPDRHPDDPDAVERFHRVRQAYDMLKEPKPRPQVEEDPNFSGSPAGAWDPQPHPFGGVHFRFVASPQMQAMVQRLRRVMLLVLVLSFGAVLALGHAWRGLPWSELFWPHQLLLSFGAGLAAFFAAFFAWLLTVGLFGPRWGTALFWFAVAWYAL